jgi:group II intron reverse transcriptase/maturase
MAKGASQVERVSNEDTESGGNLMELIPRKNATGKVQHLQRKLNRWSKGNIFRLKRIYNLLYHPAVLSMAWFLLAEKKGSGTAGIDGVTVKTVRKEIGVKEWLTMIEQQLRKRTFEPDVVRRAWIPKTGKPGKYRGLGIPSLQDRLVQMCVKLILEPIYEAKFKECSFGFRPRRGTHDAIARVRMYMNTKFGYRWVVEADFRSCFDNINHGLLLRQIRKTVEDKRLLSLIRSFLKAGVMEDGKKKYPITGTPQGGVISPLLANIYLDQLDELFEPHHSLDLFARRKLIRDGQPIFQYIRYADDFVILVKGTKAHAETALENLRLFVHDTLKLEFAEEKTGVHHLGEGFNFLGYHFRHGRSQCGNKPATVLIPCKEAIIRLRRKVKELTSKSMTWKPLSQVLEELNRVIRGWGQYFRYGSVSSLFKELDWYVNQCVYRWLRKKHKGRTCKWLRRKHFLRAITGLRRWSSDDIFLLRLTGTFRPVHFRGTHKVLPSPYDSVPIQTTLWDFKPKLGPLLQMEGVLRRLRSGGEPGERKRSRRVREAAGRNVSSGVRAPC